MTSDGQVHARRNVDGRRHDGLRGGGAAAVDGRRRRVGLGVGFRQSSDARGPLHRHSVLHRIPVLSPDVFSLPKKPRAPASESASSPAAFIFLVHFSVFVIHSRVFHRQARPSRGPPFVTLVSSAVNPWMCLHFIGLFHPPACAKVSLKCACVCVCVSAESIKLIDI